MILIKTKLIRDKTMCVNLFKLLCLFSFLCSLRGNSIEILNSPKKGMVDLPIYFISDNQFQNYLSDPTALRNKISDKLVGVAIRPPLLDLFAKDLFLFSMGKYSKDKFVIHLGDALNTSCKSEWKSFEEAINGSGLGDRIHKGWVMAPGNHDSFFFGNTLSVSLSQGGPVLKSWVDACNTVYPPLKKGNPKDFIFTKDVFVKSYYRNLLNEGKENPLDFPKVKDVKCFFNSKKSKNVWYEKGTAMAICDWKNKEPNGFIQKFRLTYPKKDDIKLSYRSYILQEVNLSKFFNLDFKIKGIILDTTDYRNTPTMVTGAIRGLVHLPGSKLNSGLNGEFGLDQIKTIKRWISENDPNTLYFFIGHHNLDSLDQDSRKSLYEILKSAQNAIYISAHTHEGFIKDHGNIKEINIGSITDFPNETMELSLKFSEEGGNSMEVFPNRFNFSADALVKEGVCSPQDFADKGTNPYFHYMSYKKLPGFGTANQVHELTIDNNLMALYKVFKKFDLYKNTQDPILNKIEEMALKSAEICGPPIGVKNTLCRKNKVDLEIQAHQVDQQLYASPLRVERIQYGACQALWAAKAERDNK